MKKTTGQLLTKLANAAFKQAARKVIERARQTGTPVIVWENGAIKKLDPLQVRMGRKSHRPFPNADS